VATVCFTEERGVHIFDKEKHNDSHGTPIICGRNGTSLDNDHFAAIRRPPKLEQVESLR
jgi:hypothetical protein